MTFRAKPVAKRAHRPSWESQATDATSTSTSASASSSSSPSSSSSIAAGLTWYNDHLASVGSVDGQSITKDEFARPPRDRGLASRRGRAAGSGRRSLPGHLTDAQAAGAAPGRHPAAQQLAAIALERLIDTKLQAALAAEEGVTSPTPTSTPASSTEATHARVAARLGHRGRAARPTRAPPSRPPPRRPPPRRRPRRAFTDLQGGKAWDDVAKTRLDRQLDRAAGRRPRLDPEGRQPGSTRRSSTRCSPRRRTRRPPSSRATDGIFRIGRVTEIAPPSGRRRVHGRSSTNDGIDLGEVPRRRRAATCIHQKLEDKIVADAIEARPAAQGQRDLHRSEPTPSCPADSIKIRHILYAPKDDPSSGVDGRDPGDDPVVGQPRRPRRRRPTPSSRPTRPSSTRSPAPRATRPRRGA